MNIEFDFYKLKSRLREEETRADIAEAKLAKVRDWLNDYEADMEDLRFILNGEDK